MHGACLRLNSQVFTEAQLSALRSLHAGDPQGPAPAPPQPLALWAAAQGQGRGQQEGRRVEDGDVEEALRINVLGARGPGLQGLL